MQAGAHDEAFVPNKARAAVKSWREVGRRVLAEEQDEDLEARRQTARVANKEEEKHAETRRETLRAQIEKAVKEGDLAEAGRLCSQLISSPDPTLCDCRLAIQHLQAGHQWWSLAAAYHVTVAEMQAIIVAPPELFTRRDVEFNSLELTVDGSSRL